MATDAEVAAQINAALSTERPPSEQELHDFPWLRRATDQTPTDQEQPTQQELHDFPWLARQQQAQPQAQAQAAPISDETIQSVVDAYNKTRSPLEWAEDVIKGSPLSVIPKTGIQAAEVGLKEAGKDIAGISAAAMRTAAGVTAAGGAAEAAFVGGVQLPNLQGMPVDQVKRLREQMLAQKTDLEARKDKIIDSGTPDEYGLYGFLQATQGLDQRIKDADAIIASGKPQAGPSGTTEPLARGLNYGGRTLAPAVSGFLDKYVPTSQEFENSLPGQIARYGADGLVLGGVSALTGPIGGAAAGGLMYGNQKYDEAKALGASDEVADRVSLITSAVTGASMLALGPVVGGLAKSFSGLTAKQGMNALVQAGAYTGTRVIGGGAEFGVFNLEQNAIDKLSGYDPNRKLDEGFWQNFWTGAVFGAVHVATNDIPHIAKMFKPDVTVRNKDGTPAQTGEQTQAPPVTPPVTPTAPTTPEQQAEAAARATATGTPEQVVAAQGDPAAELEKFMAQMTGQRAEPTTAPQPTTTAERPAAPSALEVLDAKHAINDAHNAGRISEENAIRLSQLAETDPQAAINWLQRGFAIQPGGGPPVYTGETRRPAETRQLTAPRDAAAMPPAATEHGAEPVPSNTPGPPTTVPAPQAAGERVTAAAVRQGDIVGLGVNHADAIEDLQRKGGKLSDEQVNRYYQTGTQEGAEYGFVTSTGRFVDRDEAQRISGAKGAEAIHMLPQEAAPAADELKDIAANTSAGRFGPQKVLISEVYKNYKAQGGPLSLDEFKAHLLSLARQGQIGLSRSDLITRSNDFGRPDIAAGIGDSEIRSGVANETFHFINQEAAPATPAGDIGSRILNAYNEVRAETKRPYVYIHDVLERAGVPADQAKEWIRNNGQIQLAEGDWGAARTEAERRGLHPDTLNQAGVELMGRNRILMDASGAAPAEYEGPPTYTDEYGREIPPGPGQAKEIERAARASARMAAERAKRQRPETAPVPEAPTAEHPEPQPENNSPQRRAWYEGEDFYNLPPVTRPEPEDRAIGPADVKREVNTAQAQMGMEDHLHYVPNVEALPAHVKAGLTEGERSNAAQIVRDNKLGNIYVIGDRFDSLNDLRRKIIEETLPYHYRNVTKVGLTHDNTDPRTGHYDVLSDRPILNTHAIISQDRPYEEASRALMEEADAHQGISKLLGDRNGPVYTQVMGQLLQQFRRLGLVDKLAQLRGYENAQHMAQAYGTPKWETDPRQGNKFTEELAAGYSRNFRNADELMRDGPSWWQNGLRRMNNAIRQYLGLRLSDYDVQSLLVDSAAALRQAKWDDHESQFHPIGDAAKADMRDFQMASLPPEKTATEAGETADIGTELVKGKIRNLQATLRPGEIIRAGALRQAMDNTHGVQERMNLLNRQPAVTNRQQHGEVMQAAKRMFDEDFHGNVHEALDYLINNAKTDGPGANNSMLVKVTDREVDRQIDQLDKAGRTQQANILRAKLDRMNAEQLQRQTEAGREISALYDRTGSSIVARRKAEIQKIQQYATEGSEGKAARRQKATEALGKVQEATQAAAKSLRDKFVAMMQRTGRTDLLKSLPEQYLDDMVNWMRKKFADTGTESSTEALAPVEQAFDTFRRNHADIIRERAPKTPTERIKISPVTTLNEIMNNMHWYGEAWDRTMQMLRESNPELAARLEDLPKYSIGEPLANKLAAEQGTKLSDLIYNHYTVNDRLTADLALEIARKTDINPQEAEALTAHLDKLFGDIIEKEQGKRLQSILDSVGGHFAPAKSELQRLLNHITIGGLDSKEWMNLVAPRFGIENITPEDERNLRTSGDWMVKMQDYGLANTAIAQWARTTIGDLMSNKRIPPAMRPMWDRLNYGINVIVSSLLSNPLTHIPYWQMMLLSEGINSSIHGIRVARETGDWKLGVSQVLAGIEGLKRGAREFGPIVRGGYKAEHEFLPQYLGVMRSSPLDRVPVKYHNFAWYKYVRNTLDAVSNIIMRGGQYAVGKALAYHLADEKGLSGQDAYKYADELVLGTKEQQAEADRRSHQIVDEMKAIDPDHPISEDARRLMRESILDQLKTTSDNPDEYQDRLDVGRRAQRSASRAALRGDVYGFWGKASRMFTGLTSDNPEAKLVVPFVNVPFSAVNDFMAWGPLGVWRSLKDLVPEEGKFAARLEQIPFGLGEGITKYIKDVPGMEHKLERGEFSPDAVRDLAWEQMTRGLVGMGALAGGAALTALSIKNPNPPWKLTYNGPSNYNAQQAEKGKGWIPHAMYLGDWAGPWKGWHSYENTPLRSVLAALGAISDYYRYDQKPEDDPSKAWGRIPSGWLSSTFGSPLQGLEAMLSMLVHSGGAADPQREFGQWLTGLVGAAATVPVGGAGARALWRGADPTEYEAKDLVGKSLRYVPMVNSWLLKPKLNIFGQPMRASPMEKVPEYSPTSGLGFGLGHVIESDPVWEYLDTHPGIKLSLPGPSAVVAGIRTTPEEARVYHENRGPALRAQIERAIADPGFRAMPVEEQNLIVQRVYEKIANRAGQMAVLKYRQQQPVTPERRAASRVGQLEAIMKEAESTRLPEEASSE